MLTFMKAHRRALCLVFAGALAAFLSVRGVQWMLDARGFTFVQLSLAMPGAWLLGTLVDPLLWKLPRGLNLALFEVVVATGFALNALVLTIVLWHRKSTGRWWGGADESGFERKT